MKKRLAWLALGVAVAGWAVFCMVVVSDCEGPESPELFIGS